MPDNGLLERRHAPHIARPHVALHPTPYTLHPTPYTLHPTPCTLHPTPYTLHPKPCTLHPTPYTLHPTPYTWQHPRPPFPTRLFHPASHLKDRPGSVTRVKKKKMKHRTFVAIPSACLVAVWAGKNTQILSQRIIILPGCNPGANLKSISHTCHPILWAFVWELTKQSINLPLGCLQGGYIPGFGDWVGAQTSRAG